MLKVHTALLALLACAVGGAGTAEPARGLRAPADTASWRSHANRHLLAIKPGAPSVDSLGALGNTLLLYVDVRPPAYAGDSAIDSYQVIGTPSGGATTQTPVLTATGLGPFVPGTKNRRYYFSTYTRGKTYSFTVRAHNSAGWGPLSAATPLKAPGVGVPSKPTITNITTVNGYVQVTLAPPVNQGTTAVNTYRVLGFPNGGITATNKLISVSGMGSPVPNTNKRVLKLNTHKKGLLYRWTAQAGNLAGLGGESNPRIAYLPPSVLPGAPTLAVVGALANSAGRLYVYVDFKRPTVTGDSAITYFTVRGTPVAGVTADRPLLQQTSLGVYVGGGFWRVAFYEFGRDALYRFNVRAHNQAGAGAWSNTIEFTTPDDAVPRAPALVTATVSNLATTTRVLVRVAPPTGSTGAGLTYIVTGYPDNLQLPRLNATGAGWGVSGTNQRQFAILGFVRNNIYRFTAQAVNSVGAGPERSPRVLFYQCSQYFNDTGSGCRCKVSSTGCAVKNDDRCSCKTCANTYKADGAGGCTKCPTINHCTTYSTSTCACTKCSQFFSGATCTCAVGGTGCAVKNLDGCSCKTCANTYKADGAGGCSKCPTINHCTTYSTSTCACTQCSQFFSGAACTCTVDGTNCKTKNADGCTCQTCIDGYGSDGKGSCTKCATVAKCKTYSPTDCKCTSCDQYFTVGSLGTCQCTLTGADCKLKATDGCSCQTCSDGYGSDGKGGCKACTTIPKCKTYSPTDCKCTACDQYFDVGSLGTCQCSLTGAYCAEKNLDDCSCKTCLNGYRPDGVGGCVQCTVDKCATYTENTCTCTACEANYKLGSGACTECASNEVANCATQDPNNKCLCSTCLAKHELSALKNTCTTCTVANCKEYTQNTCTCTACDAGYQLENNACGKVCDAANINDDCNTNCWCPFGPGGAAQQCTAEGKCLSLVTSLAPMTNSEAPPFPDWQWFVFRSEGTTANRVSIVTLASETAPANLVTEAPAGTTTALKLSTLVNGDKAFAGFMHPPDTLSPETPKPQAPYGLFGGAKFKDFATDSSTKLSYDWYRNATSGSDAPTLRLLLFSPKFAQDNPTSTLLNKILYVIWEPYYQQKIADKNQKWGREAITVDTGNQNAVDQVFHGGGGWWIKDCQLFGGINCGATTRSLKTLANYYGPLNPGFFDDAYILGVTLSQSNPNCIGYANNLEITYRGQALKWHFKTAA